MSSPIPFFAQGPGKGIPLLACLLFPVFGTLAEASSEARAELIDYSIGPYPSAIELFTRNVDVMLHAYDATVDYAHSAEDGYALQAAATWLQLSERYRLPGGLEARRALLRQCLDKIEGLQSVADKVIGGGPAFGLERSFDAFQDGSVNPPMTAYAFQSGTIALGIAQILTYARTAADDHLEEATRLKHAEAFLGQLIDYWTPCYTEVSGAPNAMGFFWYSDRPEDAAAVHNCSALIAMASSLYGDLVGDATYLERARAYARLLEARISQTPTGGYTWNYMDDGCPENKRPVEDISHALITVEFIYHAAQRGWLEHIELDRIARSYTEQVWFGHPARLHERMDGSSRGSNEWGFTRSAVVGMASYVGLPAGDPLLFEHTRSALFSSYLSRFDQPLTGAAVAPVQLLAIARLFERRPETIEKAQPIVLSAHPKPDGLGHPIRFSPDGWDMGRQHGGSRLVLDTRTAVDGTAGLLIDPAVLNGGGFVLSLTYLAEKDGELLLVDGANRRRVGLLPRTEVEDGSLRFARTSFLINERSVPGLSAMESPLKPNFTSTPSIHQVELLQFSIEVAAH